MKLATVSFTGLLLSATCSTHAFQVVPQRSFLSGGGNSIRVAQSVTRNTRCESRIYSGKDDDDIERSYADELNFFKANIPDEIKNEIFEAESNTQAGKERNGRLATYTAVIITGLSIAAFNTFLTTLVDDGENLSETMFGWIASNNPLNEFLFLNKIGGAIALVSAGVCGVLAEVELRARRDNVEKIWREVRRRKEEREKGGNRAAKKGRKSKKKAQKQQKRLAALSEVVSEEPTKEPIEKAAAEEESSMGADASKDDGSEKEDGGIFGKVKDLYKKADDMAAAQALLLNKELEDRGIVDKITDESGLKVIGKDAAAKAQKEKAAEVINEKKGEK